MPLLQTPGAYLWVVIVCTAAAHPPSGRPGTLFLPVIPHIVKVDLTQPDNWNMLTSYSLLQKLFMEDIGCAEYIGTQVGTRHLPHPDGA